MTDTIEEYGFGLASIKTEGCMYISEEYLEDGLTLPKMPDKIICTSISLHDEILTRKEYAKELIKKQPFYGEK